MADITNLEFKQNKLGRDNSATYSATKKVGNKTCTIFVNDRTKNGFGRDDFFFYDGDISLFSQKEIKDLIDKGADGKKYDANNIGNVESTDGIDKLVKMDSCKDLEKGKYYELGSVFDCANKSVVAEEKAQAEAKAKADAEAAAKAKAEADAKAAEASKTTPPATPATTEKPAEAAKTEKSDPTPPALPAETSEQDYYNQYGPQQGVYEPPSMAATIGAPILAGGAIGGIIGMLFGGARGFFSGLLGGALGGLMSLFGGGIGFMGGGFMGGGYDGGMASVDNALNGIFARGMYNMAGLMSQPIYVAPQQSRPAAPASNLPALTDKNFDETIKNSKTPVVVEFVMDGCKPCQEQGPILEGISKDYSGKVQIYQANIDKADAIRNEYKVDKTPTILVFKDGKVVKKLEGLKSKEELAAVLNENPSKTTT